MTHGKRGTHLTKHDGPRGVTHHGTQYEELTDYPDPNHIEKLHNLNPDYAQQVLDICKVEQRSRWKINNKVLNFSFVFQIISILAVLAIVAMVCITAYHVGKINDGNLQTFSFVIMAIAFVIGVFLIRKWWPKRDEPQDSK